jgi:biopolymer transport protein ExbD
MRLKALRLHGSMIGGVPVTRENQSQESPSPLINVTPLIDVLLVLLIIFMVAAPMKLSRFAAKLPAPPDPDEILNPNDKTLVVTIEPDLSLKLNGLAEMGTVDDASKLSVKLTEVFQARKKNHVYRDELMARPDISDDYRVEKTVFVKAPRAISYGNVTKVIDAIKGAGADPVGLQLDGLN